MSRKAKLPILCPQGIEVAIQDNVAQVGGPKGVLRCALHKEIKIIKEKRDKQDILWVLPAHAEKPLKNFLGLYWSLLANMVHGAHKGFEKKLEMIGVGLRATVRDKILDLQIGRSHPVCLSIPDAIEVNVRKSTLITVQGIDKQLVGQYAANIRAQSLPEPYKGKGIRYVGEYVRRKAGKTRKAGKK